MAITRLTVLRQAAERLAKDLVKGFEVPTVAPEQVREFQPQMVAIRDASKVAELKEAIKGVDRQPEILVGDEGAIEVARHSDVDAVVTGIVGAWPAPSIPTMPHADGCSSLDITRVQTSITRLACGSLLQENNPSCIWIMSITQKQGTGGAR